MSLQPGFQSIPSAPAQCISLHGAGLNGSHVLVDKIDLQSETVNSRNLQPYCQVEKSSTCRFKRFYCTLGVDSGRREHPHVYACVAVRETDSVSWPVKAHSASDLFCAVGNATLLFSAKEVAGSGKN